jgi:hypothetical protein
MTRIALAVVATTFACASLLAQDTKVPVFVFTQLDASGFMDQAAKSRQSATVALAKELAKSKLARVVDRRDTAAIVVEVARLEDVKEDDAVASLTNTVNAVSGGLNALRPRQEETKMMPHRFATVTVGEYSTEVHARAWKPQALASAIDQWIKLNQAKLRQPQ